MDWMSMLREVTNILIIPVLIALSTFLIYWITVKCEELKSKSKSDKTGKYIDMLNSTIVDCVLATTQTYVEALKKENAFTEEAQKEALRRTYENVMKIVTADMKLCLTTAVGDLEAYILNKIEAEVKITKKY